MQIDGKIPTELCGDFQQRDQTRQLEKSPMSKVNEFLGQVHSDLEGSFPRTRQGFQY